ncbi:hypothetical protein [Flavobacterium limi]|uniref:superoxide dismutase n=1 Tax=Flavobacterium limi TaxID=2045105 RepID=A0ABQ1UYT9_9FLAO|nr:hypothetical protein [Flavobacterium limi]GGF28584.1 hypothetical protein GCM10011518_42420 [Flavobacterium limi]
MVLPTANAFSNNLAHNNIDKLADADGNYIQQTLPYNENFLEPYMDSEMLHLHYTFQHGGAVKGANKDLQMIRKALEQNNLETVDFWTKNYPTTFLPIYCILFFVPTLPTKAICQAAVF